MVCGALGSFKVHVNLVLGCCRLHLDVQGGTRAFLGMVFAQDTALLDCLLLVSARFLHITFLMVFICWAWKTLFTKFNKGCAFLCGIG